MSWSIAFSNNFALRAGTLVLVDSVPGVSVAKIIDIQPIVVKNKHIIQKISAIRLIGGKYKCYMFYIIQIAEKNKRNIIKATEEHYSCKQHI